MLSMFYEQKWLTRYERAYTIAGPSVWNSLSDPVRNRDNTGTAAFVAC